MSDEISITEDLDDLLLLAFEHAFESIEEGETLIPFAVVEQNGERTLTRFVGESLEESLEQGRKTLRDTTPRPQRAVLAVDGFLRDEENERIDVIFVEAFEDGQETGYRFIIPYTPATDDQEIEVLEDEPMLLNECDPLF